MKKLILAVGILVGLVLVAAVVGGVFIRKKFTPEYVRDLATRKLAEALQREVKIGRVEIGLWKGVRVEKLEISEKPDFSQGTFVSAEAAALKFRLLPLLAGKVMVDRISLWRPSARLIRQAPDRWNFSDLTQPSPAAKKEGKPAGLALAVAKFSLQEGRLEVEDRVDRSRSGKVEKLRLEVSGFSIANPFFAEGSALLHAAGFSPEISFQAGLHLRGKLNLKKLEIGLDGIRLSAEGSFSDWLDPQKLTGKIQARLEAKDLARLPKNLAGLLPPAVRFPAGTPLSASLTVDYSPSLWKVEEGKIVLAGQTLNASGGIRPAAASGKKAPPLLDLKVEGSGDLASLASVVPQAAAYKPAGKISLALRLQGPAADPQMTGKLKLEPVTATFGEAGLKMDRLEVSVDPARIALSPVSGSLDGHSFRLSGSHDRKKNRLAFDLSTDHLDLNRILGAAPPADRAKEKATPAAAVAAPLLLPPGMSAEGRLSAKKITYLKYEVTDAAGTLTAKGNRLGLANGSLKIFGGQASGALSAEVKDPQRPGYEVQLSFSGLEIAQAVDALPEPPDGKASGRVSGEIRVSGRGADIGSLSGSGRISLENLVAEDWLSQRRLAKAVEKIQGRERPELRSARFAKAGGTFRLEGGRITTSDAKTEGGDKLDVVLAGTVDLAKRAYDPGLTGQAFFQKDFVPQEFSGLAGPDGKVRVPIVVRGPLDDPSVSVDWNVLVKEKIEKVAPKVEEKAKEVLRGIFGR